MTRDVTSSCQLQFKSFSSCYQRRKSLKWVDWNGERPMNRTLFRETIPQAGMKTARLALATSHRRMTAPILLAAATALRVSGSVNAEDQTGLRDVRAAYRLLCR